ncbi:MAG: hypothetical protein KFF73_07200 [Cyclobacteriaceae bacterium]|nr:hypothetical protein [Cyclobacteriaceae bacterium]
MRRIIIAGFFLTFFSALAICQTDEKIIRMSAIADFPDLEQEGMASNRKPYGPYHVEKDLNALAGDDLNYTFHMAAAEGTFPGKTGKYTVCLNTLTERDGECVYNVYVNDERVGLFQQNPTTNEFTAPAALQWTGVEILAGAKIRVESNNWSNLKRHEANFFEYARGRWTSIDFIPEKNIDSNADQGKMIGIFEGLAPDGADADNNKVEYDPVENAYYLINSSCDQENKDDTSIFLWKNVEGDFEMEARVRLNGSFSGNGQKAGLKIRLGPGPNYESLVFGITPDGNIFSSAGGDPGWIPESDKFAVMKADMIKIAKKGNTLILSAARFGEEYTRQTLTMQSDPGSLKAGIFIFAGSNGPSRMVIARFSHVRFFGERKID